MKFWKVMMAVLTVLVMAAAPGLAAEKMVLDVFIPSGGHMDFHEPIAKAFMAAHPDIEIKFRAPGQGYDDALQTLLRQNITNDLPDVAFMGLSKIRVLAERNLVQPLESFISQEDIQALGWSEQLLDLGRVNKTLYALSQSVSTPMTFYNADLVKKAGHDPDHFPATWEETLKLAADINKLGDDIQGIMLISGGDDWMWQCMVASFDGQMLADDEKKVAFNSEKGYEAAQVIRRAVTEGGMSPTITFKAAGQMFNAGLLGMSFDSSRQIARRVEAIGNRFEMRTAPFPKAEGTPGGVVAGGAGAVMLTKDPARRKAAWEYMKFATGPEGATLVVTKSGYMPLNFQAIEKEELLGKFLKENPFFNASIEQLSILRPWYAFPGENGVKISKVLDDGFAAIARETKDPKEIVDQMAKDIEGLLPQ